MLTSSAYGLARQKVVKSHGRETKFASRPAGVAGCLENRSTNANSQPVYYRWRKSFATKAAPRGRTEAAENGWKAIDRRVASFCIGRV
uniref:Uncharacterized protein n=1 Tax=Ralstonia solanacearum TaxID=305 RepID=A0A0S4WKF9_RALSL|nr:protein of unknown function [Ralstonia solanacearum]